MFLDNGRNLSGIELGFGGVWLCSVPNLIFAITKGLYVTEQLAAANRQIARQFARVTFLSDNRADLPAIAVPTMMSNTTAITPWRC